MPPILQSVSNLSSVSLTIYLLTVFINSGMAVLEEHILVAASVYNPYYFCDMRHITTI